ncbi:hypothetical protein [Desulfolithobacter sp.]
MSHDMSGIVSVAMKKSLLAGSLGGKAWSGLFFRTIIGLKGIDGNAG